MRRLVLALLLGLLPACALRSPPPYVCTVGVAEQPGGESLRVLVCRPVPPASIEASP